MAKYSGFIGYAEQVETRPDIWEEVITERRMRGDVIRASSSFQVGEKVNEDVTIQNRISLVGDPTMFSNFYNIKYATWLGTKWKVVAVEIVKPRIIITLGGVYNG